MVAAAEAEPAAIKLVLLTVYGEGRAETSKVPPAAILNVALLLMDPAPLKYRVLFAPIVVVPV